MTGKTGDRGHPCAFVEEMKQSKSIKKLTAPASKDSGEIRIGLDRYLKESDSSDSESFTVPSQQLATHLLRHYPATARSVP